MVKKVKGKAYVYLHGRDESGEIRTIYIGPLEEIANFYLINMKGKIIDRKRGWVVDRPGFEPGASRLQAERSSELSYRPSITVIMTPVFLSVNEPLISYLTRNKWGGAGWRARGFP